MVEPWLRRKPPLGWNGVGPGWGAYRPSRYTTPPPAPILTPRHDNFRGAIWVTWRGRPRQQRRPLGDLRLLRHGNHPPARLMPGLAPAPAADVSAGSRRRWTGRLLAFGMVSSSPYWSIAAIGAQALLRLIDAGYGGLPGASVGNRVHVRNVPLVPTVVAAGLFTGAGSARR